MYCMFTRESTALIPKGRAFLCAWCPPKDRPLSDTQIHNKIKNIIDERPEKVYGNYEKQISYFSLSGTIHNKMRVNI